MQIRTAFSPAVPQNRRHAESQDLDVHPGCGWFDSSYELSQGLVVTESDDSALAQCWVAALFLGTSGSPSACH